MAIKSTVQEAAGSMFETAEDTLGGLAGVAYKVGKAQARSAVAEQKNAFRHFTRTIIRAMRTGGDELRSEGYGTAAGLVDDIAGKAESMADDIDDFDLRSTTDRVESFVRARPMVAYGALALAGFVVANALHAGAQHRRGPQDEPEFGPGSEGEFESEPEAKAAKPTAKKARRKKGA